MAFTSFLLFFQVYLCVVINEILSSVLFEKYKESSL
jgi:hypothetical protein